MDGPLYRLPVFSTGSAGTPTFLLDLFEPPIALGQITLGEAWHFQCWYRDSMDPVHAANLSDAIEIRFEP